MEFIKRYRMVKGEERIKIVPRYKVSDQPPNYNTPAARKMIKQELKSMAWEINHSEKSSSTLVMGERSGEAHRAYTESTFPAYMRAAGISGRKDFLQVLNQKKGARIERLRKEAINRMENGFMNKHGYDEPNKDFLVASRQLFDNKHVVFRRVRGRIVPMRIPHEKRNDLVPF